MYACGYVQRAVPYKNNMNIFLNNFIIAIITKNKKSTPMKLYNNVHRIPKVTHAIHISAFYRSIVILQLLVSLIITISFLETDNRVMTSALFLIRCSNSLITLWITTRSWDILTMNLLVRDILFMITASSASGVFHYLYRIEMFIGAVLPHPLFLCFGSWWIPDEHAGLS